MRLLQQQTIKHGTPKEEAKVWWCHLRFYFVPVDPIEALRFCVPSLVYKTMHD